MAAGDRVETDRVRRFRPAGSTPVEVWDVLTDDGRILWERQDEPDALVAVVDGLRHGTAVSRSCGPIGETAGVDTVFLTGGRTSDVGYISRLTSGLVRSGLSVRTSTDGVFAAAMGAVHRWPDALVLDVGQTQIKVVLGDQRATVGRDLGRLPIADDGDGDSGHSGPVDQQRERFVSFVAAAVAAVDGQTCGNAQTAEFGAGTTGSPQTWTDADVAEGGAAGACTGRRAVDAVAGRAGSGPGLGLGCDDDASRGSALDTVHDVVLALPCSIGVADPADAQADLVLGGSSYAGLAGDGDVLKSVSELVPDATWWVMNDAELAVLAATADDAATWATGRRVLVLTIGFGVGGCVWEPGVL